MKTRFALMFLMMQSAWSFAQSIEKHDFSWEVSGFHNTVRDEDVVLSSVFISQPNIIKWIQKDGALQYEFVITGKTGSWDNVNKEGEITFNVAFSGSIGTIRFRRDDNGYSIETNIQKDGENKLPYQFKVSNVSVN